MAEYSRLAKGHVTTTGGVIPVILPFVPDYVELINYTAMDTPTNGEVTQAWWDSAMGQGAAAYQVFNATPALITNATTTGGISTFSAGVALQFGVKKQVITAAKSVVGVSFTTLTVTAHGYVVGDVVQFEGLYQSPTTGMPQMCGPYMYVVSVADANTFTVDWDTSGSNYTALSGSPAGAYVRKVLYPYLYAPPENVIAGITLGATTTILTTYAHNFVVGQQVRFHIPTSWGTSELNDVNAYVISITDAVTFVVNVNSSSFTAFTANQTVASVAAGLKFPQVVPIGDVNTGGWPISSGSALYPSPIINGVRTINGPAIQGAFVNNTNQGFTIGATIAAVASQTIYWRAYLHDYSS